MVSQYKLSVCPHDTAKNLLGWFTLNTYLQRKLGTGIHFDPQDNFLVERRTVLEQPHHVVVYANPYSALCFSRDKGFVPVARPVNVVDETIVVARAGAEVPAAPRIASATDKLIIHNLGLQVLQGEADLGFVFNETWAGMNATTRSELQVIGESHDGHAFHCFMVAPEWADKREAIQQILCGMHLDPSGQKVLDDLKFKGFEPIGDEIIPVLSRLTANCDCT